MIFSLEKACGSIVGWGTMLQAGRSRDRIPDEVYFFSWPNPSSCTMALGSTQPLTEMSTRNIPGGDGRPARKADNLTAICEPIVYKMWEPQHLTTLWVSTAHYRDTFTFSLDILNTACSSSFFKLCCLINSFCFLRTGRITKPWPNRVGSLILSCNLRMETGHEHKYSTYSRLQTTGTWTLHMFLHNIINVHLLAKSYVETFVKLNTDIT
jgi:hypothetical protein